MVVVTSTDNRQGVLRRNVSVANVLKREDSTQGFLIGGGHTGDLIRSIDWSKTPVGIADDWPQSLRTAVSMLMESRFPMYIAWGTDYTQFYNDGYRPILGSKKHPAAMGQRASETFAESWHIIGPMFDGVMAGTAVGAEDWMLPLDRNGYLEECYFTFSYSPIRAENGLVAGVHVTVTETTARVLYERRLRTLRDLAASAAEAKEEAQGWAGATDALSQNVEDLPFALLYVLDAGGATASLVGSAPPSASSLASPHITLDSDTTWPLRAAASEHHPQLVHDVRARLGEVVGAKWPEPVEVAIVLPIARPGLLAPYGFLIAGISPRLALDEHYRGFLVLLADHIATAIANSRILAEEKQRSEALAEIDRAKTAFFSNISHEFRTPLTLMLGPVEDALESPSGTLGGADLIAVHRNTLRLLKLVNSLLDFARVQSGRVVATYEPTDLAALTSDLASAFRSAIECGGLRFDVDCPTLPESVFVDREMWEKIVLNLLSNAFKFTFEGTIRLSQRIVGAHVVVDVADTGVGIPESEMPRLFERFHRVEGARARTQEGSGIGLALVQDLVRLHGGTIDAVSALGQGTTFRITLPLGSAHLASSRIVQRTSLRGAERTAKPFVTEALRWVPQSPPTPVTPLEGGATAAHLLVADDNADMREYLTRLLGEHWSIEAVADGDKALAEVQRRRPDLVITDVMMPNRDGIGLLRALRSNDATKDLPVIALSARAGEEARVEGLRAGFNDYVVKPFSARELVVRVEAQLAQVEVRAVAELHSRRLASFFEYAPVGIAILRGPEHVFEFANASYYALVGNRRVVGKPICEAFAELEGQGVYETLDRVFCTGEPFVARSRRLLLERQHEGIVDERFFDWVYQPMRADNGSVDGIIVVVFEVTELASARREAESANRAKDEFMAILGHELRNPLAPILTAVTLMRLREDTAFQKERSVIERQALHLVRLVDDLLDVSRITTGKVELKKERVEVAAVIAKALEMASPMLEQRKHRLTVSVPSSGLVVDGDQARLAQVFSNLLTNAAKYTESRGVVSVTAAREDIGIVISVRDTGIGISAEMLPRVFELFEQDRQALDRAHGGLGLGLSIVKSLVLMHGGQVHASSEGRGQGSEFVVVLPAADTAENPTAIAPSAWRPEIVSALRPRILVVDDNVDAAELLAESLELMGYVTRIAHDGPSAMNVATTFKPEVALLDIGLPAMDGYELARSLRRRPELSQVGLVAVTGYGQDVDRRTAEDSGFNAHLVKPVDMEALRSLLRQMTSQQAS
jgi:signal transduction histidine kinase/DNA-binding response OmpR family regulator